jgi:mevalonate kinase
MKFSCPGKIFLLGEYAVLRGMPALVATLPPRFTLTVGEGAPEFHPESPVARLMTWLRDRGVALPAFEFEDPLQGRGGLGASTAQFATLYRWAAETQGWDHSWRAVWSLYRELTTPKEGVPPSGADLIAQWEGGLVCFDPSTSTVEKMDFEGRELLVFSATGQTGRKVATHHHLSGLGGEGFSSLRPALDAGLAATRAGDLRALGRAMNTYGDALAALGLEVSETARDRREFANLPGVLGVKGAGALQSDAVLVLVEPDADRAPVLALARELKLELAANGIGREKGIE